MHPNNVRLILDKGERGGKEEEGWGGRVGRKGGEEGWGGGCTGKVLILSFD